MKTLVKYLGVACAWCGRVVRGKGWFCSFDCDKHELASRFEVNKALYEARRSHRP